MEDFTGYPKENLAPNDLLRTWKVRIKRAQLAHRFAAKGFDRLHMWMGIPAVVLSTLVATSVFASLEVQLEGYGRIIIGMLSVSATILVALQTFLRFKELSDQHQIADSQYHAIKLKIEQILVMKKIDEKEFENFFHNIRRRINGVADQSPIVPEKFWRKARSVMS